MILEFTVSNFRSISEPITLSFEATRDTKLEEYYIAKPDNKTRTLKLMALYGANASGKTNILKALQELRNLILRSANAKTEKLAYQPNLNHTSYQDKATLFELLFVANGTRFLYQISYQQNYIEQEALYVYRPNKALVFERTTDIANQLALLSFKPKAEMLLADQHSLEKATLWNRSVLASFLKSNIEAPVIKQVTDWFEQVLMDMVKPRTDLSFYVSKALDEGKINPQRLVYHLQKADYNIQALRIDKQTLSADEAAKLARLLNREALNEESITQMRLFFTHQADTKYFELEFKDESLGTQRYFQLAGMLELLLASPRVLFWDELEASLHPDLLQHFLLAFLTNEHQSQLLFTTHSRELLLNNDTTRHDAVWFIDHKQETHTTLYSLADFDTSVLRKNSSVFQAYKTGRLGALPELLDTYIHPDYGKE